jgi:hypothetical protein
MLPKAVGAREIKGLDFKKLRVFLLSLLWRAAATSRREFSAIVLPDNEVEKLRLAILGQFDPPQHLYPVNLVQLSTKGDTHNLTPILVSDERAPRRFLSYRFYFEGLIMHFALTDPSSIGTIHVGASDRLVVLSVPYEKSNQKEALERVMLDSWLSALRFDRTKLFGMPR